MEIPNLLFVQIWMCVYEHDIGSNFALILQKSFISLLLMNPFNENVTQNSPKSPSSLGVHSAPPRDCQIKLFR